MITACRISSSICQLLINFCLLAVVTHGHLRSVSDKSDKTVQSQGHTLGPSLLPSQSQTKSVEVQLEDTPSKGDLVFYTDKNDYIENLLEGCGDVCNTSITGTPSKFFNFVKKEVDCVGLFTNRKSDAVAPGVQPHWDEGSMSTRFHHLFTMNGQAQVEAILDHFTQPNMNAYATGNAMIADWSEELVNDKVRALRSGDFSYGNYGEEERRNISALLHKYAIQHIKDKDVLVIGSELPWVEAMVLEAGARTVSTMEYGRIVSRHPQVFTYTPEELRTRYLNATTPLERPQFDAVVSYSSVEHSGLGRYGDALNPWGDLQTMAKAWCMTKPGGGLFLGVPSGRKDKIFYNDGRMYGPKRWPQLTANWEQVDLAGVLSDHGDDENWVYTWNRQPIVFFRKA